jgi:hypothetical protein
MQTGIVADEVFDMRWSWPGDSVTGILSLSNELPGLSWSRHRSEGFLRIM